MDSKVVLVTGTSKGIGRHLVDHFILKGFRVIGCSRHDVDFKIDNYLHFCLDISDEMTVKEMFRSIRKSHGRVDILINNAGVASMNHALLTEIERVHEVFNTNVIGTFLFCRESAKMMKKNNWGRIVNFTTVAVPLKLEGEAIYASSKAAIVTLTHILARELAEMGITVNAIGPTPVKTDLIHGVAREKIDSLIARQAIRRFGNFSDITNVIDFFIQKESGFITGQVLYLGGV
jgi:3-oxoacyl-[acyl-carrier protein] reductase